MTFSSVRHFLRIVESETLIFLRNTLRGPVTLSLRLKVIRGGMCRSRVSHSRDNWFITLASAGGRIAMVAAS